MYNCFLLILALIYVHSCLAVGGTYEPIERLKERNGKGMSEAKAVETPSKRTKKTDKAKLVRQVIYFRDSQKVIAFVSKKFMIFA